jgi:tetratricopeptide (TPR) repeat protein
VAELTRSGANVSFGFIREDSREIALNRAAKTVPADRIVSAGGHSVDSSRRNFLVRCCQSLSATLLPTRLFGMKVPLPHFAGSPILLSSPGDFHLHPNYRSQLPLDATVLKTDAALDDFITEKYHDQIALVFSAWSSNLLRSSQPFEILERELAPAFSGASLLPAGSRVVRSDGSIEVRRNKFAGEPGLGASAFLQDLRSAWGAFSAILTAEFQIVSLDASAMSSPAGRLQTRVRYELVGTGAGFHREQRVGTWEMQWEASGASASAAPDSFRLIGWRGLEETLSRSASPIFQDVAAPALGGTASYSSQLVHGADYWRTTLDVACGIDIYGHNGVSLGDIDGDGFDDLYVCQAAGLPNRLYRNRGDGRFEDITEASGLGILDNTACAVFADYDNDGRQDVIVVRTAGPLLFINQGDGKFRAVPDAFQFAAPPQGTFTGAAVADYDNDGWLDIYFCLYLYYQGTGQYKYPSPYYDAENGPPNFMMRNNRDRTFRDVTAAAGLNQNNTRYSFCCGWNDYNRDGWPDLYVVNDFGRKNLYRNNGNGTFTDVAARAGVEDVGAGMSVCWLDCDNDGADDLYVANMWTAAGNRIATQAIFQKTAPEQARALYRKHAMGNSLFHNNGLQDKEDGFRDASSSSGAGMGRWSWSSDSWDFDHDGFSDLYITNGMVSGPDRENHAGHQDLNSFFWRQVVANSPEQARPAHRYEQGWDALNELVRSDRAWSGWERNLLYANNRDGTFSDISGVAGMDFLEDGRAFALADFDHDGRLEVFLKNRNGPQLRVLKNSMPDLPPSISFRLRGSGKSNRDAIGAVVTVETESGRQTRTLQAGSGFLSQHSKEVFFGLGRAKTTLRASIRWPSGAVQELHDLPANHRITVEEGSALPRVERFVPTEVSRLSPDTSAQAESLPDTVETWLLVPLPAPDFSLPDAKGEMHTLASVRGKPALLTLWTWRSPQCAGLLSGLAAAYPGWRQHGFELLTVDFDELGGAGAASAAADASTSQYPRPAVPILRGSNDCAGVYNLLYRYLFDRHRDLELPTSFLLNEKGEIVKVYQGALDANRVEQDFRHMPKNAKERLAKGLPFDGVADDGEFRRNYLSYGSVLYQRGYSDQAAAAYQLALRDDPANAEALYGMGSVYLDQGKLAEAQDSFERALNLKPGYPETLPNVWNNLGLVRTRNGRPAEAIPYFQKALQLSPDHLIALDNLGNAYRQLQQWSNARTTFERALQVSPEDPEANYSMGMVFAQMDDSAGAYDYLQRALKLRPGYPEALNNLGVLYLRTGRRDQAVASFEECIRTSPSFDQSYMNLARVYALEDSPEKARGVLIELLRQHPGHVQAERALEQLSR